MALIVASCGSGGADPGSTAAPADPGVGGSATTATSATVDGPMAPDFTLTLDSGAEFDLSAEEKPVYMVFWAEW